MVGSLIECAWPGVLTFGYSGDQQRTGERVASMNEDHGRYLRGTAERLILKAARLFHQYYGHWPQEIALCQEHIESLPRHQQCCYVMVVPHPEAQQSLL